MASKYSAILRGYVDFYCLVCDSYLLSEEEINHHIGDETHVKNLKSNSFVEKYKDDFIRKVKKGYFCEFCNILLTTAAKVGVHITEDNHTNNKGTLKLRRISNSVKGVLAFDKIMINEKTWNGLIEDTCVICNTEFDDENEHRQEMSHTLNLVQSKVRFVQKNIYRKIDESSFHCLTCNMVLAISTLPTHFEDLIHKESYTLCKYDDIEVATEALETHAVKGDPKTLVVKTEIASQKPEISSALDQLPQAAKKPEPISDRVTTSNEPIAAKVTTPIEPVFAKVTTTSEPRSARAATPTEVSKKVDTSVQKEKVMLQKATQEMDIEMMKTLDAKDYIANDDNGQKWCVLCDWTMDTLMIMKHVNGKHHAIMVDMHKKRLQRKLLEAKELQNNDTAITNAQDSNIENNLEKNITKFQDHLRFEQGNAVCTICSLTLGTNTEYISAHIEEHKKEKKPKKEAMKPPTASTKDVPKTPAQMTEGSKKQPSKAEKILQACSVAPKSEVGSRASSVASNRDDEEVEKFAKDHNLTRKDSKVYCHTCNSLVPSTLKHMKEHIAGNSHKTKAVRSQQQNPNKDVVVKKPMIQFVTSTRAIENGIMRDLIINEQFCLSILSFMSIIPLDGYRSKCEGCDIILDRVDQIEEHVASAYHQRVMGMMQITVSQDEFLREIRPDRVHCGFCNVVLGEDELSAHLSSMQHKEGKTFSFWRLMQYQQLVDVNREQDHRVVDMQMLVRLLSEELF